MAVVRPFCGIRYSTQHIKELSKVTAPPYDQISTNLQIDLHNRHPYNVVRLILGLDCSGDSEKENKYIRAKNTFCEWLSKGVLKQDLEPSLYLYQQEFSLFGKSYKRIGFVTAVQVEQFEKRIILPHEKIFPKPFEDRKRLFLETGIHFESIFLLYSDKTGVTNTVKEKASKESPLVEVADDSGITHKIWPIQDTILIEQLLKFWEPLQFYIADGHHRYNTALCTSTHCLATLFCLEDPNLVILPTHRLLLNLDHFQEDDFLEKAGGYFKIEPIDSLELLLKAMCCSEQKKGNFFGVVTCSKFYRFKLKEDIDINQFMPVGTSKQWMELDVSMLHEIILGKLIGINHKEIAKEKYIEYVRWPETALDKVRNREAQAAFLLNPTKIEEVCAIASLGETMPQKSTDFYPKLLSGLIMYKP